MAKDMTRGSIARTLISFSIPLIFSGLLQQLYSWADAFIVGNVEGEAALAAIGACSVIAAQEIMTLAFGCVALVALAPLISIQVLGISYKHKTATYKKNFLSEEDTITEYEVD